MKTPRTWILVGDAAGARVFEKGGKSEKLHELESLRIAHEHAASRDMGSDRPGRVVESVGHTRHAVEPKTDPHRAAKRDFAVDLAARLDREAAASSFDRLVVVLPPAMLGDFRAAISGRLKALIAGELDKDLTKLSRDDIEQHVGAIVAL